MTTDAGSVRDALLALIPAHFSGSTEIRSLQRLSADASMETWSFDAVGPRSAIALILRRRPPGAPNPDQFNRALCQRIAAGEADLANADFVAHLRATTLAKLAVDQPTYPGYDRALRQWSTD